MTLSRFIGFVDRITVEIRVTSESQSALAHVAGGLDAAGLDDSSIVESLQALVTEACNLDEGGRT